MASRYTKGETLGEGTFGTVYKAVDTQTGQVVAIKKVHLGNAKEGINMTALREIKILRELQDPHVVQLLDVFSHKSNIHLVFECMVSDLEHVITDHAIILSLADVKAYTRMILQALACCHKTWVLHRDIKPNNFLIAPDGTLKLADFGLSRLGASPDRLYTNQVFAVWYRPPELLFGSKLYGPGVDVWAAGCVVAEMVLRRPWFSGTSEMEVLGKIFQALGTPTEETWPGVTALPSFTAFSAAAPCDLRDLFRAADAGLVDLLSRMVMLDPQRRISAEEALQHPWFSQEPASTPPASLPRPRSNHTNEQLG